MKKFFIAAFVFGYFLFGHFLLLSSGQVDAICLDGSVVYQEGSQLCKADGLNAFSRQVMECRDGEFFRAGTCSTGNIFKITSLCDDIPPPGEGQMCATDDTDITFVAAETTPTPLPSIPVPKCDGGYFPNEQKCEPNGVHTCQFQKDVNGNTLPSVEWNLTQSCNTCAPEGTEPNRTAICALGPSVTPTPTTAAPITCTHPERSGINFIEASRICAGSFAYGYDVVECRRNDEGVGEFVPVGMCASYPLACTKHSPEQLGDICNDFTPLEELDPVCITEPKPAQQLMPQPGINCGIPASDLAEGADPKVTACCYSAAADQQIMPLSCFIDLGGGEDLLDALTDKLNEIIDCLPNITNCSQEELETDIFSVGGVKKILKEVPPCMPRTKPVGENLAGQDENGTPLCTCEYEETSTSQLCDNIKTTDGEGNIIADVAEQDECKQCMLGINGGEGIWTAIGCINVSSENGFIQSLFRIGITLGGAFALLCNIYGAFLFQTSRGTPETLKKAQDLITSCITGLLLIIFSVFILRLIGYEILRIPGFG